MLYFASCLRRVNFSGRGSVGLSGVVSLILSGFSRAALSSICVGSLVVLGFYLLVPSLFVGSPLQQAHEYSEILLNIYKLSCMLCTGVG